MQGWPERKLWLLRSADRRVAVRLRQEINDLLNAKVQWCLLQLLLTEERQHLHVKGRQIPKRKWMNSIKKNGERGRRKKRKQWKRRCVRTRAKRKRGKEPGISKSQRIRASGTKDVQEQRYSMLPCCCFLTR